jgi:hypothetical protein
MDDGSKLKKLVLFSVNRLILSSARESLNCLEDISKTYRVDEKDFLEARKKVLDSSNSAIRFTRRSALIRV